MLYFFARLDKLTTDIANVSAGYLQLLDAILLPRQSKYVSKHENYQKNSQKYANPTYPVTKVFVLVT